MIIVDTSVWVDYFKGKQSKETDSLDTLLGSQEILLGDLILTEILQGFQEDRLFREAEHMLESFPIVPMLGIATRYPKCEKLSYASKTWSHCSKDH